MYFYTPTTIEGPFSTPLARGIFRVCFSYIYYCLCFFFIRLFLSFTVNFIIRWFSSSLLLFSIYLHVFYCLLFTLLLCICYLIIQYRYNIYLSSSNSVVRPLLKVWYCLFIFFVGTRYVYLKKIVGFNRMILRLKNHV